MRSHRGIEALLSTVFKGLVIGSVEKSKKTFLEAVS